MTGKDVANPCLKCEQWKERVMRMIEVLDFVRESSLREADGFITIEPDAAEALVEVVDAMRVYVGWRPVADKWP